MLAKFALPKTLCAETDVQLQSCEDVPCAPTLCFFPNRGIEVFPITSYSRVNMKSYDLPLAQKYNLFPGSQLPYHVSSSILAIPSKLGLGCLPFV